MFSPIIVKTSFILIPDNFSSKPSQHLKNFFVEQARVVNKRKVETKFDKENYIVSLRRAINTINGKHTVCMIEKHSITSDYTANQCTHIDFHCFLQWKKNIYYIPYIYGLICAFCYILQINDNLHKWISQGELAFCKYSYPNWTLSLVFVIFHYSTTYYYTKVFFGVYWPIEIYYTNWLCNIPIAKSKTNMMQVILWFLKHCRFCSN